MSDSHEAEGRTDIDLQVMLEQTSKALQDAPLQIIIDLLLEELLQREANAEADQQIDNAICWNIQAYLDILTYIGIAFCYSQQKM